MSWQDLPKPDGVGDITDSDDGFEVSISVPSDEDGFFARECPSCEAPFKMRSDEYEALPDEVELDLPILRPPGGAQRLHERGAARACHGRRRRPRRAVGARAVE